MSVNKTKKASIYVTMALVAASTNVACSKKGSQQPETQSTQAAPERPAEAQKQIKKKQHEPKAEDKVPVPSAFERRRSAEEIENSELEKEVESLKRQLKEAISAKQQLVTAPQMPSSTATPQNGVWHKFSEHPINKNQQNTQRYYPGQQRMPIYYPPRPPVVVQVPPQTLYAVPRPPRAVVITPFGGFVIRGGTPKPKTSGQYSSSYSTSNANAQKKDETRHGGIFAEIGKGTKKFGWLFYHKQKPKEDKPKPDQTKKDGGIVSTQPALLPNKR